MKLRMEWIDIHNFLLVKSITYNYADFVAVTVSRSTTA